jgi:hypothetical protein
MVDPVTVGALTASALAMAGDAIVKGVVGETVKDSYKALKGKIAHWAGADVDALEKAPTSAARQAVVAEIIDAQPADAKTALRPLIEQLTTALKASGIQTAVDNSIAVGNSKVNAPITSGSGNQVHNVTVTKNR